MSVLSEQRQHQRRTAELRRASLQAGEHHVREAIHELRPVCSGDPAAETVLDRLRAEARYLATRRQTLCRRWGFDFEELES